MKCFIVESSILDVSMIRSLKSDLQFESRLLTSQPFTRWPQLHAMHWSNSVTVRYTLFTQEVSNSYNSMASSMLLPPIRSSEREGRDSAESAL